MKKPYLLLLFTIVVLSSSSCSVILRENYPRTKTLPTGWSEVRDKRGVYEFKYKDVSMQLSASYRPAFRVMSWGPPLIPLIPKVLYAKKDILAKLLFYIIIESPTKTSSLNLSQIKVYGGGQKTLRVHIRAVYLGSEKLKEIPIQAVISKGKTYIYLECDSTFLELEQFVLDLGCIIVGDEEVKLAVLEFRKTPKYIYGPFVIGNHLEDYYQ
jgi:hypothetical protein